MNRILSLILAIIMLLSLASCGSGAPANSRNTSPEADEPLRLGEMRRPLSAENPMLIVHIDTWNSPDPQKIIDLMPEELLPYIVFNISLSVSHDDNGVFRLTGNAYETTKSWIRTCAENNVWCMVQPSSGGYSNFPDYNEETDYETTLYAEFFRDYPNFLGFNYCEQFWGFAETGNPPTVTVEERYDHFCELLKLCNKYGGYLVVSWCGNMWGQAINPLAMLKTKPNFEETAKKYSDNLIMCDKYTQEAYKHDVQSMILGFYLSGYCGNFGVRYDETAWSTNVKGIYTQSTGLSVMLESLLLSGATVIDGPELVPEDDFKEIAETTAKDGYTSRNWQALVQYRNVTLDMFKKLTEGSLRIPTREEVIDRAKLAIVQDIDKGKADDMYCTPKNLYEGLYRMEGDGGLEQNFYHYKTNGRYPTIPEVYKFADPELEKRFDYLVNASEYKSRWANTEEKVAEFDTIFPEEYTGDMYAGRYKNTWVTYSYYLRSEVAKANIPLKYNTCDEMELNYRRYTAGVITEYADRIDFYLNNFDDNAGLAAREDVIVIKGAKEQPTYTVRDRGEQIKTEVTEEWSGGVYTLKIKYNGPVDLTINCQGNGTGKLTDFAEPNVKAPAFPRNYHGDLQYEAECFDYKNIAGVTKNGYATGADGYTGQGYLNFGKDKGAQVRDIVTVRESGIYMLKLHYTASADISGVTLSIGGKKYNLDLTKTNGRSDWQTLSLAVDLKSGQNEMVITAKKELESELYIDNVIIAK